MTALTKAELSIELNEQLGLNIRESKQLVQLFFEAISHSLETGEAVHLSGFGNFTLRDKSQRPGRNPKTGDEVLVEARRVTVFHPGKKLREFVENQTDK